MSVMSEESMKVKDSNHQSLQLTSLSMHQSISIDQLTDLYGKSKPSDIAKSLVYGDKPKMKENKMRSSKNITEQSYKPNTDQQYKSFNSNSSIANQKPSKFTILSHQLLTHISDSLDAHKSQRAFHVKDHTTLLSPERLNSLPNHQPQDKVPEVCNRLIEYSSFVSEKKKTLKEQVESDQMNQCSFQPSIDQKSRQMAIRQSNQEVRSADDFHDDQMKHQFRVQEKREQALRDKEESELNLLNNPKLNPNSQKYASKYSTQPLLERLNDRQSKTVVIQQEESYPFKPEISKKSKQLKREESVQDALYKDAKNRLETKKMTETMVPESVIQPTDKSLSWFVQRFIKEFYFQLSSLERVQESKDYSKIYEEDFQYILVGLGFGQSQELWNLMNNGFYVLSRNLLVILLAIMAVPQHLIEIPLYKPKVEENVPAKSQFQIDENGNVILSEYDCQELHKQFYTLYLNTKLQSGNSIRRAMARSPQPVRCQSPKISEKTKQLADNKKANMNLYDWFESQEKRKKDRLELLKQQVQAEEMKECKRIVRPVTINLIELAKPLQKQEDRSAVDIEFENQVQHCTFQPQISQPARYNDTKQQVLYDIQKQAARMKEARVRQKTLQNLKQKGSTTNNKTRRNEKFKTEANINSQPKPVRAKSRPMFESVPLLFVDVKIDDAKTARIVVYEGDKSQILAEQFANQHNLDESMKYKLKELLDVQINSLLTKIDEEGDDEQ